MDDTTIKIIESIVDNYYKDTYLIGTDEDESEYLTDLEEVDDDNSRTWTNKKYHTRYQRW